MAKYSLAAGVIAGAVSLSLATNALADDSFARGLVGGIIGGAIANSVANSKQRTTTTQKTYVKPRSSGISSAQRESNREVQRALNHFGFAAGTPDGVLGSKSRSAVSQYQALLSFPVDGTLNDIERSILTTAYQRAMMGGQYVTQTVSTHPMGMRGLLIKQKDEALGVGGTTQMSGNYGGLPPEVAQAVDEIARNSGVEGTALMQRAGFIQLADMNMDGKTDYLLDTSKSGSQFWCSAQSCIARVFASTPTGYRQNDFQVPSETQIIPASFTCQQSSCMLSSTAVAAVAPAAPAIPEESLPDTELAATKGPAVPSFLGGAPQTAASASLASFCSKINLVTASNGGFMTEAAMTDPAQALGEQFCLARSYAIDEGETMLSKITGFTVEQVEAQCKDFAALMKTGVTAIPVQPRVETIAAAATPLADMGLPQDQVLNIGKICLSVGYRKDDMDVAIASALAIAGTGNAAYEELLGHHLVTGIGMSSRPDLAKEWYGSAVSSLDGGAKPAFQPGQPERIGVIRKASMQLGQPTPAPAASGLGAFGAMASQASVPN